jgi:hypothetical protein
MNKEEALDFARAMLIDRAYAKAFPGSGGRNKRVVDSMWRFVKQDEKLPTLSELVSFAKSSHK